MGDIMFTTDEIFARMMNGESMDSIAKEMSEALNAAKAKKDAEDKRKAEEEAKAKREVVVNEAAEKAANAVNELIRVMYPEMASATEQLTAQMLRDMVDSSYTLVKEVEKAFPMFEKFNACGLSRAEAAKQIEDGIKAVDVTKCSEKEGRSCAGKRSKVATLDDLCEEDVDAILKSFCEGFNF